MAANLRTKLPKEDTLYIFDVNKAATTEFQQKFGSGVQVASSVGEVVEHSVSPTTTLFFTHNTKEGVHLMNVIISQNCL